MLCAPFKVVTVGEVQSLKDGKCPLLLMTAELKRVWFEETENFEIGLASQGRELA